MKPDYETLLHGATTWYETYRDIQIELSFHRYRSEGPVPHPGTWCYYLRLVECAFSPEDWRKLVVPSDVHDFGVSYDYYKFPDLDFYGGVTFYKMHEGFDRLHKRPCQLIKVGCDYAHLWDMERGYPDDYESVLRDAKRSVDVLLEMFPDIHTLCAYSGLWDVDANFYVARNGKKVHKNYAEKIAERGDSPWSPTLTDDQVYSATKRRWDQICRPYNPQTIGS